MAKIKVHELAKELGKENKDIMNVLIKNGVDVKSHMSNVEEEDAKRVRAAFGGRTAKMKEDEEMQKDTEAGNKAEGGTTSGQPPKKKNIIQVFRPQNSKTGMVKPGSRPRPQGQAGKSGAARPGAARPQNQAGRPQPAGRPGTAPKPAAEGRAVPKPQTGADPRRPEASAVPETKPVQNAEVKSAEIKAAEAKAAEKKTGPEIAPARPQENGAAEKTQPARAEAQAEKPQAPAKTENPAERSQTVKPDGQGRVQGESRQGNRGDGQERSQSGRNDSQERNQSGRNDGQERGQGGRNDGQGRAQSGRNDSQTRSQGGRSDSQSRSQGGRSDSQGRSQGGSRYEGQSNRQGSRYDSQSRGQSGRSDGQGRSQGGRSDSQGRSQGGSRYDSQSRGQGENRQSGRYDGQGENRGSRYDGQNRSQGGRYDGQSRGQGENRQGSRYDGQSRSQGSRYDGQSSRSGEGRQSSRYDGQNRNQGGRSDSQGRSQGGRSASIPKPPVESPLEKESRKRTERGDRNRVEKGEKLDRMEKNQSRTGQKSGRKNQTAPKTPVQKPAEKPEETIRNITIPDKLTVTELAEAMKVQPAALVKKLFLQGTMVTVNQEIDFDTAEEIALEFNCICEKEVKVNVLEELLKEDEEAEETMVPRSPVVCVMGHVDHGKTSLLDAIRNTHVIDKEAGGITQHIGAYVVSINGQRITFLDTPGHEAFTAMRMRGANSTDIAILVVAADDGVMPQTIEAINHAKAAGIEIIVAINKIDKPSANIDRVKQELTEYELIPEDWGGSTVCVPVSAHTHEGIDNLLEMILLTAEVAELKANPNRKARGLVIEAELDKGKGPVATVLVQKGTLHVGDPVAAGSCYGKVRAMMDDKGRRVKEAGPSTPVEILGFSDVPNAGEIFMSMDNEKEARSFAETFISEGRERLLEETRSRMSLDDLFSQIQAGNLKELDIIVKADVQGSVEAVKQSLLKLSNEEVVVKIIHGGVGAINESDVILASASNAIIIGFNVRPDAMAKATAEREGVDVRLYRVIYDAIADVEAAMKGMLDPIFEEKVIGHAEVRQTFKASGVGTIAGAYILDGVFQRGCSARVFRDDKVIFEGPLASLKRFKDDVKEVRAGYECGFVFEKFNDIKEEDKVEAFVMVEVPR